jgi:hypothetical protein
LIEGQLFLGATNVPTDLSGNASFTASLPLPTPTNWLVTATATDMSGNTSEFSAAQTATVGEQGVRLAMAGAGSVATVVWPKAATLYRLEATGSLGLPTAWNQVTSGIVDVGEWSSLWLTNVPAGTNQFFRLRKL